MTSYEIDMNMNGNAMVVFQTLMCSLVQDVQNVHVHFLPTLCKAS